MTGMDDRSWGTPPDDQSRINAALGGARTSNGGDVGDLIAFVRARLDEDEAVAKTATAGPWRHSPDKHHHIAGTPLFEEAVFAGPSGTGETDDPQSMADAAHIARHDPARVLRQAAAMRAIAELHTPVVLRGGGGAAYYDTTVVCRSCEPPRQFPERAYPCETLRHLAATWADHPDYRDEWRP